MVIVMLVVGGCEVEVVMEVAIMVLVVMMIVVGFCFIRF